MSSENILNQWLEEERQVRERLHPVGVIPIAQLAAYTGLEFLKKIKKLAKEKEIIKNKYNKK